MKNLKTYEGFLSNILNKKKGLSLDKALTKLEVDGFKNVGLDEEQNVIGNCKKCGCNGVLVHEHKCKK